MRCDVERAAVVTPTAIASKLVCEYGAEVFAGRSDHQDASGTGSPDVALRTRTLGCAHSLVSAGFSRDF